MIRYNVYFADRQVEALQNVSVQTQVSVAEVIRRIVDFGFQLSVLNQLFPCCSGKIDTDKQAS